MYAPATQSPYAHDRRNPLAGLSEAVQRSIHDEEVQQARERAQETHHMADEWAALAQARADRVTPELRAEYQTKHPEVAQAEALLISNGMADSIPQPEGLSANEAQRILATARGPETLARVRDGAYHCPCGWSRVILDDGPEAARAAHEGSMVHTLHA